MGLTMRSSFRNVRLAALPLTWQAARLLLALAATGVLPGPGAAFDPHGPTAVFAPAALAQNEAKTALDAAQGAALDIRPQDVIDWSGFEAVEGTDGKVTVLMRMTTKSDWKVYASNLKFAGPPGFTVDHIAAPPSRRFLDPISGEEVDIYEGGEFTLTLSGTPRWTGPTMPVSVTYVGCTNVICLFPYTAVIDLPFAPAPDPASGPATAMAPAAAPAIASDALPAPTLATTPVAPVDFEQRLAERLNTQGLSFVVLLGIVFLGGLLSNLTPCVYPMIPITLRLLSRSGRSPYTAATCYALGIVVSYSALGLVAALSGGLFGSLLANKTFNLVFAGIMMLLAATMLGFGDFSKLQVLGSRFGGSGPASLKNTFLMGTGAGLVAAPCTGPILAALLAYTAKNNAGLTASITLLFVYSLGFGLPYIFLGGAAAKVSQIKVPHQVQIATKLLFAAVMFGLGLYYLRIPFYTAMADLRGHWQTIALAGLSAGVILSAVWTLVPRLHHSKYALILPAAILGTGIFGASQWLTASDQATHDSVHWYHDEATAYAAAAAAGKPMLIDMWAEWCEACKKMDATTFSDPAMLSLLGESWVLLKLDLTESNAVNEALQQKYELQSLPTLVLLPPEGTLAKKQAVTGYVSAAALTVTLNQFHKAR